MKVPVSTPDITEEDIQSVTECMKAGWISGISPWVEKFEKAFAKYVGTRYAIATSSGTTALHLSCAALNIERGDEVIMPTFTMIASANAVNYLGTKPVFVDSYYDSWCIDIEQVKEKITKKTVAIMPVHVYGHPCDMKALVEIAEDRDLYLIEDAAESHGAEIEGLGKTGSIGDVGAFSLYANKIITTGEGGMITTDHQNVYERAQWLRTHAFGRHGKHYWHEEVGYGYRMSGLQGALGLSQVPRIDHYAEKRRNNAKLYMKELAPYKDYFRFPVEFPGYKNVYWMFSLVLKSDCPLDRNELMMELDRKDVETRTFFFPLHVQPPYKTDETFINAELLSEIGINLPSGNQLTEEQIKYVCDCIEEIVEE